MELCLCCGCVGLWHDDLGQKIKSHCQGLLHCYGAHCWLELEGDPYFQTLYLRFKTLAEECTELNERRAVFRSVDYCVGVGSHVSASDQVQSLVDCWTGSLRNLFTVAKFYICTEMKEDAQQAMSLDSQNLQLLRLNMILWNDLRDFRTKILNFSL